MHEPYPLSDEQIARYRRDGFIQLDDIVAGDDLKQLREAVVRAVEAEKAPPDPNRTKSPYERSVHNASVAFLPRSTSAPSSIPYCAAPFQPAGERPSKIGVHPCDAAAC